MQLPYTLPAGTLGYLPMLTPCWTPAAPVAIARAHSMSRLPPPWWPPAPAYASPSGSADVLEALGVNLNTPPERAGEAISSIGIAFLFAPAMHTAMRHAI